MPFALPALLLAVAARAAPVTESFEMTLDGAAYGTEDFQRAETPEGVLLTGKVALNVPNAGAAVLKQELRLAKDGRPLSYALDINAPGQQFILKALPHENGFTFSLTPRGSETPAQSKDVVAGSPALLLDNNFASHLDVLTRGLVDLAPGAERTITALVPQVFAAIPGSVKRGADGKATLAGAPVATRSYHLVVANVATELVVRGTDGALLRADVPLQHAVLARRGFEGAASPSAASKSSPADPRETPTEIKGPAAALPATLLQPKSESPVPAVVFLSGSGPNDRDETIGPNKPFADLARGLGDRGIASLRFDKRTLAVKDKDKLKDVTLADEYDDDAKVAIAQLAATPGIDPARIFVVGHSEGAMLAPRVASGSPSVRGVVMMAPGVRPIDAIIIDQLAYGAKITGLSADEVADQTKDLEATFAAIRDPKRKDTPPFMGAPAVYWRELIALDVAKSVKDGKVPVLVLQGDQDIQVRKDADFELLRSRVGDGGGRVTYKSFAGLNHLFMKVEHGSTGAEYGLPGHVDPAVVSAIADWILLR